MKMIDLANDAFGRWDGILLALGVDPAFLKKVHGPCPFCGGKDRFLYDDKGAGKWICQKCGYGDGFDLLQKLHGWTLPQTMDEVAKIVGSVQAEPPKPEDPERKAEYMRRIWKEAKPVIQGDPVWLYLSRRCGDPTGFLADIRFHPALKHSVEGNEHPAMVARMRSQDGKRGVGLHRTYLTEFGQKAEVDPVRMSFGEIGTIHLCGLQERLGLAEGIETAICASKRFRLPVWAATCAHGLESWEPPTGVSEIWIFGDNDASYTGQAAAYSLAKKLTTKGLAVQVRIPGQVDTDWADNRMDGAA